MKYSQVLFQYQSQETGDFMSRYYVNNREYIMYSPKEGEISCLELHRFRDLTAYQLAASIGMKSYKPNENIEEICFKNVCSKENLISYLFDIDNREIGDRKVRRVSNTEGYLLYEITPSRKIRNFFQFNIDTKESQLVFGNKCCFASIFDKTYSASINVCWSPFVFSILEAQADKRTSYLLASSNPLLCAFICKVMQEKSSKVNLCVGEKNSLEALLFLVYYIKSQGMEKTMSVYSDDNSVTVFMGNWHPLKLLKFVGKIQKQSNAEYRKLYLLDENSEIMTYQLESVVGVSCLIFPNDNLVVDIFLRNVITELAIENISYQTFEQELTT